MQKKIIYRTNQILTGVTNKIKAVKVIDNIVVEEILTGLKTPTENFVSAHRNLNIQHNIKELAEK